MAGRAPLKRLHPDGSISASSLKDGRKQPVERIVDSLKVDSLKPGRAEPPVVMADGTVMQGNHRVKVLQERGYDVDRLPRVPYP